MQFREDAQLDTSRVTTGGGGRGGKIAVGGGAGLIIVVLALIFGLDPSLVLGGTTGSDVGDPGVDPSAYAHCRTGADAANNELCAFVAYDNSIEKYWASVYTDFRPIAELVTFTGQVSTACGAADSSVGPFYCPGDEKVYLDLSFFEAVLQAQLGAQVTQSVQAYVVAHEIGHHIQNLTGQMEQAQASRDTGPGSPAVRLELQADCYAGAWFAHAADDPASPIAQITQADLDAAIAAAAAIGDDRIQQTTQGRVTPEAWTHGSAEQRQAWLQHGFVTGDPNQCNTFTAPDLDRPGR